MYKKKLWKKILLLVLTFLYLNINAIEVYALGVHGRFRVVDKSFPTIGGPYIMVNSDEILDLGGSYDLKKYPNLPVQKYNISTKTLTNLHSTMTYPRGGYSAIKYDATHILLVGGTCRGNYSEWQYCHHVAEIYDISSNSFTRISNTHYEYYNSDLTLLSDGRVLLFRNGEGEIFDPATKSFTVIPHASGSSYITSRSLFNCQIEIEPNEVLFCLGGRDGSLAEVLNMKTFKLTPIKVLDDIIYEPGGLGEAVQVSPDTVLFLGFGEDMRGILKLDIPRKELSYAGRLPKPLVGDHAILLDNGEILFLDGALEGEFVSLLWYSPAKVLVHAVYDYKRNKIYKWRKASYFYWYIDGIFPEKNSVYILDYNKLRKYTYKVRKERL